MMSILALVMGSALAATPIQSGGNLGLGLGGGTGASGLSVKYFVGSDFAVQGVVGFWGSGGGFSLSVDGLFEQRPLFSDDVLDLAWNVGAGGFIGGSDLDVVGAAGVLGLEFDFVAIPIDLVLEYRPALVLIPDIGFDPVSFGAHIRIYPF